jgi:hypothetical protein
MWLNLPDLRFFRSDQISTLGKPSQRLQNTPLAGESRTFVAQGSLYHGCNPDKSLIPN